ncbi:MAG TPA: methyltransferase domain-containing protein [Stellaceae bacterium]|nr:methyltransferase domain-containing protein [Stellaceae bacterium]
MPPAVVSPPPVVAGRGTRFIERLHRALNRSAAAAAPAAPDIVAANANATPDPFAIRQRLYGRGYVIPGDAAWLLSLVEPFELGASSSMLELAAGLGGPARAIAQAFHTRVIGIERDYERARQGNAMSSALGASHLVRIRSSDPETLSLGTARFDCALGREASYAVAEKERFLRVVAQSLRTRGQIVLTDFVLDRSAGERPEFEAWRTKRTERPSLWTAAQYADCFKSLGYGLRRTEDISTLYRRQIIGAWVGYLRAGDIRGRTPAQIEAVLAEAESCFRTVAALESGALKYYRFEAIAHYSFW